MKKIWLIAKTTYAQRIRSGSFLMLTFGIPILMVIAGAVPFFLFRPSGELPELGYVDQTGSLAEVDAVTSGEGIALSMTQFPDQEAAQAAYEQDSIQGYLVVPEGYFEGENVSYYAEGEPDDSIEAALAVFLRKAIAPDQPDWIYARLEDPASLTYVARETGEQVSEGIGLILRFATPAVLGILFGLAVMFTSTQMGSAVVREKEQRAMEMVITSMRPFELVAGKVSGIVLLSFTQLLIWAAGAGIAIYLAFSDQLDLLSVSIPWGTIAWGLLLAVPGYFLFAVIAAGLGVIAGDKQGAQQLAGFLGFAGLFPLWFAGIIISDPNGALAVGLTLFPLTAPTFALLRMTVVQVPLWQLLAAEGLIIFSLIAGVWFVARIFRAAMLNYGKSLNPAQLWIALRQAGQTR